MSVSQHHNVTPSCTEHPMIYYINRQSGRYHETCDEFDSRTEADRMCREYQYSEHGRAYYYVSRTARPNWNREQ